MIASFIIMFLQAIENGKLSELEAAVLSMKQETEILCEHCLDICDLVPHHVDTRVYLHPMTLLAFAGYHANKEMLDLLIREGASKFKELKSADEQSYNLFVSCRVGHYLDFVLPLTDIQIMLA